MNRRGLRALALLLAAAALTTGPSGPAAADVDAGTDLGGEEVGSSTDAGNPTELVAGVWAVELEGPGSLPQQFSYTRTMPDSTVHVGVSASGAGEFETLELEAFDEANQVCESQTASADSPMPWGIFGARLRIGPDDLGDRESTCLTSDVVRFSVGRSNVSDDAADSLPATVRVIEEAPLARGSGEELPEAGEEPPAYDAPDVSGEAEEITGATSLADAPLLETGRYALTLTEGEEQVFRVPQDWGESFVVRAVVPPVELAEERFIGPDLSVGVLDPLVSGSSGSLEGADGTATVEELPVDDETGEPVEAEVEEATVVATNGTLPVRYRHRYDSQPSIIPGEHFLAVRLEQPEEGSEATEVPMELEVEVRGEVTGAPEYAEDDPFLVADGRRVGDVSGVGDSQAWRLWVGLGLGGFGAVCVVLGGLRLRRR